MDSKLYTYLKYKKKYLKMLGAGDAIREMIDNLKKSRDTIKETIGDEFSSYNELKDQIDYLEKEVKEIKSKKESVEKDYSSAVKQYSDIMEKIKKENYNLTTQDMTELLDIRYLLGKNLTVEEESSLIETYRAYDKVKILKKISDLVTEILGTGAVQETEETTQDDIIEKTRKSLTKHLINKRNKETKLQELKILFNALCKEYKDMRSNSSSYDSGVMDHIKKQLLEVLSHKEITDYIGTEFDIA